METDYTVIEAVRQHFGDDPTGDIGVKGQDWHEWLGHQEVPFVGLAKDFPFGCPAVDRTEWAVLQLLTYGVTYDNVIQVNGVDVPGGLSLGGSEAASRRNPLTRSVPARPARAAAQVVAGSTFWLRWNRFVGSYSAFSAASRR